jgi:hypothetical protein
MYPGAAMDQTGSHLLDQTGSHRLDQTGSHRLDQTGSHRLDQTGSHRLDQTGSHRLDQTGSHRLGMTGSQPPVSAMTGQIMPMSRSADLAPGRSPEYRDYSAEVAEAAQYSAVPYSAMPYSAEQYDAYAIAPQSMAPNAVATHVAYGYEEPYSTGSLPRVRDREYADQSEPSYPGSWGAGPEQTSSRAEFRSGPRARFS